MDRDNMSGSGDGGPLPPARTRTIVEGTAIARSAALLPPVVSGPHDPHAHSGQESFDLQVVEVETSEVTIELTGFDDGEPAVTTWSVPSAEDQAAGASAIEWFGDDESLPWEPSSEGDDGAVEELVLIEGDVAGDGVEGDAVPAPSTRPSPPPLSPWDLGAASIPGDSFDRAARARAEWESLGQELSESLSGSDDSGAGPHGYDLTDERAAELEGADGTMPFGGPIMSVGPSAIGGGSAADSPMIELARRLEGFAANLRDEGAAALSRAQTGEDRFDALLASIAAGFLAGRGE